VASMTPDTSLLNFLLNLYTCCRVKHAFTVLQLHVAMGLLVSLRNGLQNVVPPMCLLPVEQPFLCALLS
jgi:hypothetical protein